MNTLNLSVEAETEGGRDWKHRKDLMCHGWPDDGEDHVVKYVDSL